jgi:hypothetical protein
MSPIRRRFSVSSSPPVNPGNPHHRMLRLAEIRWADTRLEDLPLKPLFSRQNLPTRRKLLAVKFVGTPIFKAHKLIHGKIRVMTPT